MTWVFYVFGALFFLFGAWITVADWTPLGLQIVFMGLVLLGLAELIRGQRVADR